MESMKLHKSGSQLVVPLATIRLFHQPLVCAASTCVLSSGPRTLPPVFPRSAQSLSSARLANDAKLRQLYRDYFEFNLRWTYNKLVNRIQSEARRWDEWMVGALLKEKNKAKPFTSIFTVGAIKEGVNDLMKVVKVAVPDAAKKVGLEAMSSALTVEIGNHIYPMLHDKDKIFECVHIIYHFNSMLDIKAFPFEPTISSTLPPLFLRRIEGFVREGRLVGQKWKVEREWKEALLNVWQALDRQTSVVIDELIVSKSFRKTIEPYLSFFRNHPNPLVIRG